jgi:hypothetical protein
MVPRENPSEVMLDALGNRRRMMIVRWVDIVDIDSIVIGLMICGLRRVRRCRWGCGISTWSLLNGMMMRATVTSE